AAINKDLGRDKPLLTQYVMYLNDLSPISWHDTKNTTSAVYLDSTKYGHPLHINLGSHALVFKSPYLRRSYQTKKKVTELVLETLPETFVLAFASMLLATILGVGFGIIAAIKKNSWFDRISFFIAIIGMSGPSFFVGLILMLIFGYWLSDYTGLKVVGSLYMIDEITFKETLQLKNLILPAVTLGIRPWAIIQQLTRSSLLEVLSQDYIRTAKAKGLSYYKVVFKHALKNALNPVITSISGWLAGLMAGAVLVENVFDWKGIGNVVVEALNNYDLPVVMGSTLVFATIFIVMNVIVDIIYGLLDPRVRVQ
ncbi:MAG TPA: ABC transporter permease, partial [Bacteroidia bacterium]|nr:ABC transporter permease [Bacteroidia bacterium]